MESSEQDPLEMLTTPEETTPENVTLTRAELERLQGVASSYDDLANQLTELRNQRQQYQAPAPVAQPQPQNDNSAELNQEFWADPIAAARKLADDRARALMQPVAEQFAAAIGNQAVTNFRMEMMSDPYYAAVKPVFDKKVGQLSQTWLGSLTAAQQAEALSEAWNASLGEYVSVERKKRPIKTPVSIGGGGGAGGGGGSGSRTLQEVDPLAYAWAMRNGLSEEDMAEIARDAQKGEE